MALNTVDVECITIYYHYCAKSCLAHYQGTGRVGMEAVRIFQRSKDTMGVRYVQRLGDSVSKGFYGVVTSRLYGDSRPVEKLESVGHVQKQMGTGLQKRTECS